MSFFSRTAASLLTLGAFAASTEAATFTVINTLNSGAGSLRQAIASANGNGNDPTVDLIDFNIPGAGVHTILTNAPFLQTTHPVTIDGTTQPGFTGLPLIELTGVGVGIGLNVGASHATIRGLVINNFVSGVVVDTQGSVTLTGNFIGTDESGSVVGGVSQVSGVFAESDSPSQIGGPSAADANVIGGWSSHAIIVQGNVTLSNGSTVEGNFIGVDRTQTTSLPNGTGVALRGVDDVPVRGNVIAHNTGTGVVVEIGDSNPILDNSIYGNAGGISLLFTGNADQPAPVLVSAASDGFATAITGTQAVVGSDQYRLQFFTNPAAERQGRTPVGETLVAAPGNSPFSVTFPVGLTVGQFLVATATHDLTSDTSEFSNDLLIAAAPVVAKAFVPPSVVVDQTSTLTVTLSNAGAPAMTGVSVDDTYPAGLVNAAAPLPGTTCGGTPVFTVVPGAGSFSVSGLSVPGNSNCAVTVAVSAAAVGSYANTLPPGAVDGSNGASLTAAGATLAVGLLPPPGVAKAFAPATIQPGGASTLSITLTNGSGIPITGVAFTDTYPAGVTNAAAPNAATTCGAGLATALPGGNSLALSGGTIPANGSCTVSATVTVGAAGSYVNDVPAGAVSSSNAQSNDGIGSSATLVGGAPAEIPALSRALQLLLALLLAAGAVLVLRRG